MRNLQWSTNVLALNWRQCIRCGSDGLGRGRNNVSLRTRELMKIKPDINVFSEKSKIMVMTKLTSARLMFRYLTDAQALAVVMMA